MCCRGPAKTLQLRLQGFGPRLILKDLGPGENTLWATRPGATRPGARAGARPAAMWGPGSGPRIIPVRSVTSLPDDTAWKIRTDPQTVGLALVCPNSLPYTFISFMHFIEIKPRALHGLKPLAGVFIPHVTVLKYQSGPHRSNPQQSFTGCLYSISLDGMLIGLLFP